MAEEVKQDAERVGKPVKVIGGMLVPPEHDAIDDGDGSEFTERGVVLCYESE